MTSRNREFAFFDPEAFLSATSKRSAREYYSEIEWVTGAVRRVQLDDDHDRSAPVFVEYLPQAFVERVCNADLSSGDSDEFERELRDVLFTHISEQDRAGEKSFDALLNQKTRASQDDLDRLRDGLRVAIDSYVEVAEFRANTLRVRDQRTDSSEGRRGCDCEGVAQRGQGDPRGN